MHVSIGKTRDQHGGGALVFDECQPPARRKWGGLAPPILAPKNRNGGGGGGQKVQKSSKESTFDAFCTEFSLNWDRKPQFFRALRARSIIHSLQLGSHPRLGPKVACFTTICAQKCLKRIKKRTKATQNDKNVHTPLKTTFFTVCRKNFS